MTTDRFEKLVALLEELFQLDQPELDFGFYRIMHARREQVTQFLRQELLPQVRAALGQVEDADRKLVERELEEARTQARALGADPDDLPKVRELRKKLDETADLEATEADVYDHLYRFFRRYYSEGDFISRRVYKDGVYAIPYEGEEVKLHWANADQYYIKTDEYLRNYAFRLRPDHAADPMRVHFRLVDAAEGEHDNVKAPVDGKRVFVLCAEDFVGQDDGKQSPELVVDFRYRPATIDDWKEAQREGKKKPPGQKDLLSAADERILARLDEDPALQHWAKELRKKHTKATGDQADYSRLRGHLDRYAARNRFDYFIHKDLGGFLRRELDFYIKNEVMRLDDIDHATAPRVEQYLSKIRAIRRVAGKVIDFLAQLEDFQKRLWLKKKFVVETSWLVRLGCVPDEFLPEIAANHAQRREWVELCAIDEIADNLASPGYSEPLSEAFLRAHPSLVMDTRHFSVTFAALLPEAMADHMDALTDGVLFHSENFQALSLMQAPYRKSVQCIYIDPPYNTGDGDFPYKDSYRSSSWLAMISNRLRSSAYLLRDDGSLVSHIDEHEFRSLEALGEATFGKASNIGPIVWDKRNPKGDARGIGTQHEYLTWFLRDSTVLKNQRYRLRRPKENAQEILNRASDLIRLHGGVNDCSRTAFRKWMGKQSFSGGQMAYRELEDDGTVYRAVSMAWPNKKQAPSEYFRPLLHPKTGKPCPVPARGWRNPPATMDELVARGLVLFGADETTQPTRKYRLVDNMTEGVPSLYYFGGSDDSLQNHMGFFFPNPKPVRLAEYIATITLTPEDAILDYFAGSGTTGHAVINLNREDGGRRRFVLVEMGEHFDTVLVPRLKKVIYSPEWKNGKPQRAAEEEETERSPRLIKLLRLESFEDTLNNLRLPVATQGAAARGVPVAQGAQQTLAPTPLMTASRDVDGLEVHPDLREQYVLENASRRLDAERLRVPLRSALNRHSQDLSNAEFENPHDLLRGVSRR